MELYFNNTPLPSAPNAPLIVAKALSKIRYDQMRFGAFIIMIIIYGLFGAPTPDTLGNIELLCAALMVFALGISGICAFVKPTESYAQNIWYQSGRILLLFGFSAVLIVGILSGHTLNIIFRDCAAFLFLGFPVLYAPIFYGHKTRILILICAAALSGILFAMRDLSGFLGKNIFYLPPAPPYSYLSNAPSVLFAAILCAGLALRYWIRAKNIKQVAAGLLCAAATVPPLLVMTFTLQRASTGLFVIALVIILLSALLQKDYRGRTALIIVVGGIVFWLNYEIFQGLGTVLILKSTQVGFNMRFEEFAAIWEQLTGGAQGLQAIPSILWGAGWGGTFHSPAVGNMNVGFTHGLIGYVVLKTGLIGAVLTLLYIGGIIYHLCNRVIRTLINREFVSHQNIVVILALLSPLIIDVFLYAAFKSLDFGLLLMMCAFATSYRGEDRTHDLSKDANDLNLAVNVSCGIEAERGRRAG